MPPPLTRKESTNKKIHVHHCQAIEMSIFKRFPNKGLSSALLSYGIIEVEDWQMSDAQEYL
jgi:hypothetical protein